MLDSIAEEDGRGRVDRGVTVDVVGPSTTKAVSAEPKLKLPSGRGIYASPLQSSLSHTSDGLTCMYEQRVEDERQKSKMLKCTYLEQSSQVLHSYLVEMQFMALLILLESDLIQHWRGH